MLPNDGRTANAFNIASPGGPSNPNMINSPAPTSSPIPTTKTTRGSSNARTAEGIKDDASTVTAAAGMNTPMGADGKPHVTALRVTPASIKAFIRYFATDVVGSKYEVPKDYINAMIALTESLFYK